MLDHSFLQLPPQWPLRLLTGYQMYENNTFSCRKTVMKERLNQWKALRNKSSALSMSVMSCCCCLMFLYHFKACIQLHGHSAASIQSPLKDLEKTKTESLFDIEIMTPRGTERKLVLDGVERSHLTVNTSEHTQGCVARILFPKM